MKINLLIVLILTHQLFYAQSINNFAQQLKASGNTKTAALNCNNWLKLPSQPSYVSIGKLAITGTQLTVEAAAYRTSFSSNGTVTDADLVTKHSGPFDANYILRSTGALITTSDGFFQTPPVCPIVLNKTYHYAMVYDGSTLKFYRDGFLLSQAPAHGTLWQNDWETQIGLYDLEALPENFIGYINEVRIWNVTRTQAQIQAYSNTSLPAPASQPGLLAYYTFDDLLNKQGNAAWNGTLSGQATINNTLPDCSFVIDSCEVKTTNTVVTPVFTTPDTVCVNTPVTIKNTTAGASSYYWNFCVADLNTPPSAVNMGNIGGYFSQPTFVDYAFFNNNYYGFVTNYQNGNLTRLDFGNSLLNSPTAVNLGNFSGILFPTNIISEGIQIVFNEGRWYAIVVGSSNTAGTLPRIFKVDFGANLTNIFPLVTDWGNVGNLAQPIDLHIFKDGNNWYGFTANSENNTITRFNFTNSFNNTPTAINLGNLGNLSYPTGIYAIDDSGFWRVFVVNGGNNNTVSGPWSLSRLDFGNSLLNTPSAINLGNPGTSLSHPRDITVMKSCGQIVGFVVNGNSNNIIKLDFNNNLSSVPSVISLGNIGSLNFPHSISRLFRIKDELYSFVTNASGASNSLTRLRFTGCTNSSLSSSILQNPSPVTYNLPGIYHINLSVDDGLATQAAFCKEVVVLPPLVHTPLKQIITCTDSVKIGTGIKQVSYLWNTGATTDSIYVKGTGIYWVETSRYGCSNRDSFNIAVQNIAVKANNDTAVCSLKPVQLNASVTGNVSYQWSPATGLSNPAIANPVSTTATTVQYIVTVTAANGCIGRDTVVVAISPKPIITKTSDTIVCHNKTLVLHVSGGNQYVWTPSPTLSSTSIPDPIASPVANTTYYLTVTNAAGCSNVDSVRVAVQPIPVFKVSGDTAVCSGSAIQLSASGGNSYTWQPAAELTNAGTAHPTGLPAADVLYTVKIKENTCNDSASLSTLVTVLPLPNVQATSSNDIDCTTPAARLTASGALQYLWQPSTGLTDSAIAQPLASPGSTVLYSVKGIDANGCSNYDTVAVMVTHSGDLLVNMPNAFTPNGDGKNDCFGVGRYASLLQRFELSVYDRFGVRVFYSTSTSACWDGRYKGKLQDAGGFVYILNATTFCGNVFKKGIVMLIK